MSDKERRSFSRDFKLKAVVRLEAGESGSALARELDVKRLLIYCWSHAIRTCGELALRGKRGRRTKADAVALTQARGVAAKANDLTEAPRQIAELRRRSGSGTWSDQ